MLASELVDYGIQTEDSDIRAHVSVVAGKVYVFPTKLAVALVKSGKYPERKAWQPGIPYPVSYTHLDVYKRQLLVWVREGAVRQEGGSFPL